MAIESTRLPQIFGETRDDEIDVSRAAAGTARTTSAAAIAAVLRDKEVAAAR